MFARMQATSPAYSTLYYTVPQIIRSCEPHASTDTFASRDKTMPLYVLILVYQSVISITEPRAQAVSTAAAAAVQTSGTFGVLAVFEVLHSLPYTSRRVLVLQYWYSHTSECVAVKRCRYHAIRGSVVCTWYVSYEYGRYTVHYIPGMVLLYSHRSTLASYDTWSYVSCHLLGIFGRAMDLEYERE